MPTQHESFVNGVYSQARAAGLTDTQARLAASQAAVETGYGNHLVGNNMFGIKAGRNWTGPVVNAGTTEEIGGALTPARANFRSYDTPAASLGGWSSLVSHNWPSAYQAEDFDTAVDGLNAGLPGGYATDSNYGSKLRSVNRMISPQAEQTTGIMGVINPATVSPVERGLLAAPVNPMNVPGINATPDLGIVSRPYVDTQVTTAYRNVPQTQPASVRTAAVQAPPQTQTATAQAPAGLSMSPQEAAMDRANRSYLSRQPQNTSFAATHDFGQMAQKALGAIAGGLLGGAVLGPVGGLLGSYVGKQVASPNGLMGNNNFPSKPEGGPKGDGGLTSYGRSAMQNSPQARSAMTNGSSGLF